MTAILHENAENRERFADEIDQLSTVPSLLCLGPQFAKPRYCSDPIRESSYAVHAWEGTLRHETEELERIYHEQGRHRRGDSGGESRDLSLQEAYVAIYDGQVVATAPTRMHLTRRCPQSCPGILSIIPT